MKKTSGTKKRITGKDVHIIGTGLEIAPFDENKVGAGAIILGGAYRVLGEKGICDYQILLGERMHEPYEGLLAFPTGKLNIDERLQKEYAYLSGRRVYFEAISTALRELKEEIIPDFEQEDRKHVGRRRWGDQFAIYDSITGYTVYLLSIYNSRFEKQIYNFRLRGRSDLRNPRFYTMNEVRQLQKNRRLAPIVMPCIKTAIRLTEEAFED